MFDREPAALERVDPMEPGLSEEVERLGNALCRLRSRKTRGMPLSKMETDALGVRLKHPLSDIWMSRRAGAVREIRAGDFEREYFDHYYRNACEELGEYSTFKARCLHLASAATGEPVDAFRSGSVYLNADRDGTTVRFPAAHLVEMMMQGLHRHLIAMAAQNPYRPIHALVGISGIHPFLDANGRCARFWTSVLASIGGDVPIHMPLRAIAEASRGGFELRIREAEVRNRWLPVVRMFTLVVEALEQ